MDKSLFITREFIKLNPHVLFVFGDNDIRQGLGGMAKEFRGEPNTMGIRTKKKPSMDDDAFYTDEELFGNIKKITEDGKAIMRRWNEGQYKTLYVPEGIGEGFAKLKENAPFTYKHLKNAIALLRKECL